MPEPIITPAAGQSGQSQSNQTAVKSREVPIHERPLTEVLPVDVIRTNPSLRNFKNIGDLAKGFVETKSTLGKRLEGMVKVPSDDSPVEEIQAFRNAVGIPGKIDEYPAVDFGENNAVPVSPDADKWFRETALELGLTKQQFSGVYQRYMEKLNQGLQSKIQMEEQYLTKLYGAKLESAQCSAKNGIARLSPDLRNVINGLNSDSNIVIFQILSELGSLFAEDHGPLKGDSTPSDPNARINAIDKQLNDPNTAPSLRNDLLKEKRGLMQNFLKA